MLAVDCIPANSSWLHRIGNLKTAHTFGYDDTTHADVHASIKLVQAEELEFLRERIKDENREILLKNDDDVNSWYE